MMLGDLGLIQTRKVIGEGTIFLFESALIPAGERLAPHPEALEHEYPVTRQGLLGMVSSAGEIFIRLPGISPWLTEKAVTDHR